MLLESEEGEAPGFREGNLRRRLLDCCAQFGDLERWQVSHTVGLQLLGWKHAEQMVVGGVCVHTSPCVSVYVWLCLSTYMHVHGALALAWVPHLALMGGVLSAHRASGTCVPPIPRSVPLPPLLRRDQDHGFL